MNDARSPLADLHRGPGRDEEAYLNSPPESSAAKKASSARLSRRRTKTGCLTCRRRRIKCGEERPICANCIKSKRQCEGYNQRVIFKDPLNTYRGPTSNITAHSGFVTRPLRQQALPGSRGPSGPSSASPEAPLLNALPRSGDSSQASPSKHTIPTAVFQGFIHNDPATFQPHQSIASSLRCESDLGHGGMHDQMSAQWDNRMDRDDTKPSSDLHPGQHHHDTASRDKYKAHTATAHPSYSGNTPVQLAPDRNTESSSLKSHLSGPQEVHLDNVDDVERYQQEYEAPAKIDSWNQITHHSSSSAYNTNTNKLLYTNENSTIPNPSYEAGYGYGSEDDSDPFDVTDDHDNSEHDTEAFEPRSRELQKIQRDNALATVVAVQAAQTREDTRIRTYHSVIENYGPNMLANYHPSSRDSPLSNPISAGIFCHFINVIAPSLSMFERHPANPSIVFRGDPVPKSQQHIWSYTMPTIALRNHALCHAMLAMSSLHIAKLENEPITVSLRHYHIAIRKLAKNVGSSTRRKQLATFATTLLLGYYEVISADHSKWCDHLLGAHQLVKQIDFSGITTYLKTKRKARLDNFQPENLYYSSNMALDTAVVYDDNGMGDSSRAMDDEVDENLVGIIMGKRIKYAEYAEVIDEPDILYAGYKKYTKRELETFSTQQDLFWWYAKHEIFQSILSQNKLFLNYERWSDCPPRAPLGRRDAVYGTFDHLVLLLGRVCNFAAKDLKRKKKAMAANRGQWIPPPSAPGEPNSGPPRPPNPQAQGGKGIPMSALPSFAGMLPGMGNASLPRGFSPSSEDSPPPNSDESDERLDEQTAKAVEEWDEIRSVFGMFEQHLGPDFAPLGREYAREIPSPFGPAIQYRTYGIALMWLTYYMGLIVCYRSHPSMPPSAMMAAGISAQQTGLFANMIGRISAGITADTSTATRVNIGTGAALTDSCIALFVAGVQIRDQAQRSWIIQRMLDVERLTGFETASHIALGCETSWTRAAEMGRGPPYTRYTEPAPVDQVWSRAGQRMNRMLISAGEETHISAQGNKIVGRVRFAVGILGVTDSLSNLDVQSDDETNE